MKLKRFVRFLCIFPLFFSFFSTFAAIQYDPLLVVVVMVKDEEHVMAGTLQPYVDAGLKHFLILDTGSTDNTIGVTHQFFKDHGITHYFIEEDPFVDFSYSRNRALDLAEQHFPNACFMLMVDAEWYMHNVQGLIEYCKNEAAKMARCYFIRLLTPTLDYYLPRMMRCGHKVRYIGVVHETIDLIVDGKAPESIWFEVRTTKRGEEKSNKRLIRDRDMLLKYLEKHPDSPRDTFYLAQTFGCLLDYDNAIAWYLKRSAMNGWEEENYMALYRLAEVYEILSIKKEHELWWPKALEYYLKAYQMRPIRAESIIRIAHHYLLRKEWALAYMFAKYSCEVNYPLWDILFVEKDLYNFYRYDIIAQTAFAAGAFAIGEEAARKALQTRPQSAHLYRYLAFYLETLQKLKQQLNNQIPVAVAA